jgi:hypothetical protein
LSAGAALAARREYDLADRNHALLGLPDHGERLLADLSIGRDAIGAVQVELIDLVSRYELIDIDDPLALDRHGFKLLGSKFNVVALADLVPLDDVGGVLRYLMRWPVFLLS